MKIEELCKKLGVEYEDIKHKVVVEPERSLGKLKEFEEKYGMTSEEMHEKVLREDKYDEVLWEWDHYYCLAKHYSEKENK